MTTFISRRAFLKALGLTTAGLAIGGGAALGADTLAQAAQVAAQTADRARTLENQLVTAEAGARQATQDLADLRAQLQAALEANARLAADLSAAHTREHTLNTELAHITTNLRQTEATLASHREQLGAAHSLIQLFDELEATGLDATVQTGLAAALGGLVTATALAPTVRAGTAAARALLDDLETVRQNINTALSWLGDQMVQLKVSLFGVEQAGQAWAAGAALGGAVQAFAQFAQAILRWVPFGWGQKATTALTATQNQLEKSHTLAREANDNFFGVAARHFANTPHNLTHTIADPVRTQALAPAEALSQAVENAHLTLETQLAQPTRATLEQRAHLRARLAQFRAQHGL